MYHLRGGVAGACLRRASGSWLLDRMVDANGLPATSIATLVSHLGEELLVYASRPFPTRAIASHVCGACTETRALLRTRACAHGH